VGGVVGGWGGVGGGGGGVWGGGATALLARRRLLPFVVATCLYDWLRYLIGRAVLIVVWRCSRIGRLSDFVGWLFGMIRQLAWSYCYPTDPGQGRGVSLNVSLDIPGG